MIETWEAQDLEKVMRGGRTHPLKVGCWRSAVGPDGVAKRVYMSFAVKSEGNPEVTPWQLANELVGTVLARHFSIYTARPVLINISPQFVAANRNDPELADFGVNLKEGLAVGIEWMVDVAPVDRDYEIRIPKDLPEAARLFAFDMLVQNPDRTRERKTNCAAYNERLLAFDFEMSFSFAQLIFSPGAAWQICDPMAQEHLFFRSIRRKQVEWDAFLADLKALSQNNVSTLFASLPPAWTVYSGKILSHMAEASQNADKFVDELRRVLK